MAVISANDLNFIKKEHAITLVTNILDTVANLPKWNGHLYNWYNIKNKGSIISTICINSR